MDDQIQKELLCMLYVERNAFTLPLLVKEIPWVSDLTWAALK